jgi:hypothetical protein
MSMKKRQTKWGVLGETVSEVKGVGRELILSGS